MSDITRRQKMGSVIAAIIMVLALADAPDQFRRWLGGISYISAQLGIDWTDFWKGNGANLLLALLAVAIGLWAWDVPSRIIARRGVNVVEEAKRRAVRAQASDFLRRLYDGPSNRAVSGAFDQAGLAVARLREDSEDRARLLAADLRGHVWRELNEAIRPVLDTRDCDCEHAMMRHARAWGVLFERYQRLVQYTHEAHVATGTSPWSGPHNRYAEWRMADAEFLAKMRQAEHMEGCEALVYHLRAAGWGEDSRPAQASPAGG